MKKEVKTQKKEILIHVTREDTITKVVKIPITQFTMATKVVFDITRQLGPTASMVYLTMLSHRNTTTNDCHPSIETLSKEMNLNKKTIKRAIDALYNNDFININSGMRGISNNYYFLQEPFYDFFIGDFLQEKATRREGKKKSITEKRETKEEKRLKKENEEKDRTIAKQEKEIIELTHQMNMANGIEDDDDFDDFDCD